MPLRPKRKKKRPQRRGLGTFFLRGVVTLLPVVLTLVVFGLLFQFVKQYVTQPINRVIYWSLEHTAPGWSGLERLGIDPLARAYLDESRLPVPLRDLASSTPGGTSSQVFRDTLASHRLDHMSFVRDFDQLGIDDERLRSDVQAVVHPLIGVLVSVLLVLWLGWLAGAFVGRKLVMRIDRALHVIPVFKSVYPYSKQLVEFFFAEKELEFDTVVCVPYPSKGLWSLGFVTSSSMKTLRRETQVDLISVFIPSSPMPMTGYTIFVEASRVIPIPISVDEALRITMTGGVLIPPAERVGSPDSLPDFGPDAEGSDPPRPLEGEPS